MPGLASDKIWRKRFEDIDSDVERIRFPDMEDDFDQDEEWCEAVVDGETRKIRFHDYSDVFEIPGMYEELFYEQLECCSPSYITNLLTSVMEEYREDPTELRVLDVGAGNGMMGDELADCGVETIHGIDIIPAAKEATLRDRPGLYDGYFVVDLTDVPEKVEEQLRREKLNCLTTVAALGFGDIPPLAFAKALDLVESPGWMAFNIKENFLAERDDTGFAKLVRKLNRDGYIRTYCYRRYQHRVSIAQEPLYYMAVVARKLRDLDKELWDALADM
jgi:predicted TPR repeat methyltransferase